MRSCVLSVIVFLLSGSCIAFDWERNTQLIAINEKSCEFWQLAGSKEYSRALSLDWKLVDKIESITKQSKNIQTMVAVNWWSNSEKRIVGSPTYNPSITCSVAIADANEKPDMGGTYSANITEIVCYERKGGSLWKSTFKAKQLGTKSSSLLTYACITGCEHAPFARIHENSLNDDGRENGAFDKDLDGLRKKCSRE